MTARWLEIEARHRRDRAYFSSISDFTVTQGDSVDPRVVLEDPNLSLFCLEDATRTAVFTELPPKLDLEAVTFVNYTQYEAAQKLLEVPYDAFVRLAAELPKVERLIVQHNSGRSGSTLLSQVFARLESVYSLSEPDTPLLFKSWWKSGSEREDELKSLLDSSMRFLYRPAATSGANVFAVKPRNEAISIMDLFQACYPGVKNLFLYRSAVGFAGSFVRLMKRMEVPESRPLDDWLAFFRDVQKLDLTPLVKYLDEGVELIPNAQMLTLWWLSNMERYVSWYERGIPALAVRYEDLNAHREAVLSGIFEYCDLPISTVERALGAFAKGAQEGTGLDREKPGEEHLRMREDQVEEVLRVLARHPVINASDFIAPGTLQL